MGKYTRRTLEAGAGCIDIVFRGDNFGTRRNAFMPDETRRSMSKDGFTRFIDIGHDFKHIATLAYWNYALPPRGFEMEPNASIAPCPHTCVHVVHKEIRENDLKLYRQWRRKTKAPMFLWNYHHPPMEPALIDRWKWFPNVMVHRTANSMRMFIRDEVRGIFVCGEQDMLEAYVIAKLWDEPEQDVDALLHEFFERYFGASAMPMQASYGQFESIACNPGNYPPPLYKKNGIDWRNVAWTHLGTPERMERLGALMAQAEALAQTEIEKCRVALWHDAFWTWMQEGRAEYFADESRANGRAAHQL